MPQQPYPILDLHRVAHLEPFESGVSFFIPGPSGVMLSNVRDADDVLIPWADFLDFLAYAVGGRPFNGSAVPLNWSPEDARFATEIDAAAWEAFEREFGGSEGGNAHGHHH